VVGAPQAMARPARLALEDDGCASRARRRSPGDVVPFVTMLGVGSGL